MAVAPTYGSRIEDRRVWHVPGDVLETISLGTIGGSDTYAAGGFAITAANLGLSNITYIMPITFSNGYWGVYVPSTGKIKVYKAVATELDDTSANLQSATFIVRAVGH